jgi:hypothetical protein
MIGLVTTAWRRIVLGLRMAAFVLWIVVGVQLLRGREIGAGSTGGAWTIFFVLSGLLLAAETAARVVERRQSDDRGSTR